MSMHDPVADMLTRIRNAQRSKHTEVSIPASKLKHEILKVLKEEGYISDFHQVEEKGCKHLLVDLKYYQGRPVIETIRRVSRPGLRVYKNSKHLPKVSGFGVAILTTSHGVMTQKSAEAKGIGGEVICEVA